MPEDADVSAAFELLLQEVDALIEDFNSDLAQAAQNGDYGTLKKMSERGEQLVDFRNRLRGLQKEWDQVFAKTVRRPVKNDANSQIVCQRLQPGLRTPEDAFRIPILEALSQLGGSGPADKVLDAVYAMVGDKLNEYDHQPIPSAPNRPRWRNTAQWCRRTLVNEGLLASETPRGIWEITDAGRRELQKYKEGRSG